MYSNFREKLIVFDFDKTLTRRDTFLTYLIAATTFYSHPFILLNYYFGALLVKLGLNDISNFKERMMKWKCRYQNIANEEVVKRMAKKIEFNNNVLELLRKLSAENQVLIVSASPEFYIKEFFPEVLVLGLKFDCHKMRMIQHPFGEEKKKLLYSNGIEAIDVFFTDSYHDIPLMKISTEVFLIKNGLIREITV